MIVPVFFLVDTMNVYSNQPSRSRSGGAEHTPELRDADIPCRVEDKDAAQKDWNFVMSEDVTHVLFTEYNGTQNGDTIEIQDSSGEPNNIIYAVIQIKRFRAAGLINDFFVIGAREVKP